MGNPPRHDNSISGNKILSKQFAEKIKQFSKFMPSLKEDICEINRRNSFKCRLRESVSKYTNMPEGREPLFISD